MEIVTTLAAIAFVLFILVTTWQILRSSLGALRSGRSKGVYVVTCLAAVLVGSIMLGLARDGNWNVGAKVVVAGAIFAAVLKLGHVIAQRIDSPRNNVEG